MSCSCFGLCPCVMLLNVAIIFFFFFYNLWQTTRVYTKVYKQFELLSVFSEKGWRESEWFCHPALRPGHVSSASIWMFPYRKTLHLKRQQDHVVSFGAWAAFYKLHKQKSAGCQHTKSKLSQMVKVMGRASLFWLPPTVGTCSWAILFCKSSLINFISLESQLSS